MPCFHPVDAWFSEAANPSGKRPLLFKKPRSWVGSQPELQIPCGQCIGCRLEYSRQWAVRCMHEKQLCRDSMFLTLTYDNERLPPNGSLVKSDLQKFNKRYRKYVNKVTRDRIRFFACGEYGDCTGRPHYHMCVFNHCFTDGILLRDSPLGKLFFSPILAEIWGLGNCSYGSLTFESAAYVARYVTKKVTGDRADAYYRRVDPVTGEIVDLVPEFATQSRRPGIGSEWYDKYKCDVYPSDEVVTRGQVGRPPRYYDKKLDLDDPDLLASLKERRLQSAEKHKDNCTKERLKVREQVAYAKLNLKTTQV